MKNPFFNKTLRNANKDDINRIASNLDGMNRGPIKEIWDKVTQLWKIVKNPIIPWPKKVLPIAALVYLISPIDAVPDPIPVAGLLDDVGVIIYTVKQVSDIIRQTGIDIMENQTRAHLYRMRVSLIVSICVAILAIIVTLIIRAINAG